MSKKIKSILKQALDKGKLVYIFIQIVKVDKEIVKICPSACGYNTLDEIRNVIQKIISNIKKNENVISENAQSIHYKKLDKECSVTFMIHRMLI